MRLSALEDIDRANARKLAINEFLKYQKEENDMNFTFENVLEDKWLYCEFYEWFRNKILPPFEKMYFDDKRDTLTLFENRLEKYGIFDNTDFDGTGYDYADLLNNYIEKNLPEYDDRFQYYPDERKCELRAIPLIIEEIGYSLANAFKDLSIKEYVKYMNKDNIKI